MAETTYTGVSPVNRIKFKLDDKTVKDAESLSIAFDNGIEEWNPMDQDGWVNRLMTSKSCTISMGGKRNYGDEGNDYVASFAVKNGEDCYAKFTIEFPNGATFNMPCVVNVTTWGGESTAVDALEWEVQSNGKPTYTAA
jgi:hypothetical protein